ncbi:hypothetical protein BCR36DRAFT_369359 [Piromyces finnis]|uniref:t-SNARE coiled-coil homology domain-containing protein n=1 Tax=Piromyces finnis TaxID=1754191 RepID=A0A1Y1VC68_9FUNG|nr:hypothetical protein BCR36DRAFT_369359 [Piromyces finnis]|eukprot:ORX52563.1 hypothetical protein BCR36DRAFT_369359 [Piromyces finnis]
MTQNDIMVSIKENVDQVDEAVQQGSSEMTKAIKIRQSSRKKLWITTVIITILILVIGNDKQSRIFIRDRNGFLLYIYIYNNSIVRITSSNDSLNTIFLTI